MQNKKQTIQDFLAHGKSVISVNSRVDGVKLPKHLMDKIQVKLSLSLKFPNPIDFNKKGIETKLSFAGKPHKVVLPYDSIYGISDFNDFEKSFFWEEETPKVFFELAELFEDQFQKMLGVKEEGEKFLDFKKEAKKLKKKKKA